MNVTFINLILILMLSIYIVVEIKRIKSNKEVIKVYTEISNKQKKANELLEKEVILRKEHKEEHRLLKKKLDSVNRKLTIVNKYNCKKY